MWTKPNQIIESKITYTMNNIGTGDFTDKVT